MSEHFEIGKVYKHSGGGEMKIVGSAFTTVHGACLIGEEPSGRLRPIGSDSVSFQNWEEIELKEWESFFTNSDST